VLASSPPLALLAAAALAPAAPGFDRLAGDGPRVGEGRLVTYAVDVERALGLDPAAATAQVEAVLAHPRGWTRSGRIAFRRVDADADTRILLARPATVDRLCAPLPTAGRWSCAQGRRVVLNGRRWQRAVPHWDASLADYRRMLVNHEVGHRLGLGHVACPAAGERAPVMVQQSKSLQGCRPGPWPRAAELGAVR
jgi:hypothetical protein